MGRLHALIDAYGRDHAHPLNRVLRLVCAPAMLWSVIAMAWTIPVPGTWFQPGAFAGALMAALAAWTFRASRPLGIAAALALAAAGSLCWALADAFGMRALLIAGVVVCVTAWVGRVIGDRIEGRRPRALPDPVDLAIGPAWALSMCFRRLGIAF